VFAAFADRVCPDRPLNEQIMFFHMLNAPNQRTLLNELRDDMFQGDVRKVNKMLGDMEKFSAEALKGEDRTELAEEIGRLLTEMHFPPHLFFDRMAIQKEKEEEKATSAVDAKHYPLHFGNTPSAAPIRVLPNMHPVLAALRREIDVPVSFDTAKVAAQFVAGAAGMCSVNDSLLGRKQVRDDVRANASEVIASCKAEDVCNLLDAVASSIPSHAILAHPHTQAYYNALCQTCGPQYVQRTVTTPQQLYGMMLKAHVATEHDIQTTDNDKVMEVGKEYAQKESSEELVSLVINGKC
jgi:hypothetical protein